MIFKLLVICFIGLGFSQSSYSAETCITNAAELAAKQASFPKFLQQYPPVMFTRNSFPVSALIFRVIDGKILGEAVYKLIFGVKKDNGYVTKLCYDGTELTANLEIGTGDNKEQKEYKVKVINDRTIEVKGLTFKQTSPAEFAKVLNKLSGNKKSTDDENSSAPTTGAQ